MKVKSATTWCSRPVRNRSDEAKKQQKARGTVEIVEVVLRFMEHLQRSMKKNGGSHSPPSQHSMIPIEALRVRSKQETLNPRGDEEKARDSAFMRGEGKKKREQVNIKQEEERGKKAIKPS